MKSVFLPKDNHGEILHAHGGQILIENGIYTGLEKTEHRETKFPVINRRIF